MKVLVTGSAGFIGFHLTQNLLKRGFQVVGIDNINDYYDPELKLARLAAAGISRASENWGEAVVSSLDRNYTFFRMNLEDKAQLEDLFKAEQFDAVCNLAAQAGVRYSIENPSAYISSNIVGFLNVLEACRNYPVQHLVYASSSSVYGNRIKMPLSTDIVVNKPVSLYAATKISNELMAYTYSHLYKIPVTGLRFFTVYGPWGRPDMAPILFSGAIVRGEPIKVFNNGELERDFTYVDDIVEGISRVLDQPPVDIHPSVEQVLAAIYNIGNGTPVKLLEFIKVLEKALGKKAIMELYPMQPGDVYKTYADISALREQFGYVPKTSLGEGIRKFADWFKDYYLAAPVGQI